MGESQESGTPYAPPEKQIDQASRLRRLLATVRLGRLTQRGPDLSAINSMSDYINASSRAKQTKENGAIQPSQDFMFQYYGVEAIPRIFPQIQRNHLTVNYEKDGDRIKKGGLESALSRLPDSIEGIPTKDILETVGESLKNNRDYLATVRNYGLSRYDLANGSCATISSRLIRELATAYPVLKDSLYHVLITSPHQRIKEPPRLKPLYFQHSIFGIEYQVPNQEGPMILSVDATVAQVDRTNTYDVEVTTVRKSDYEDYLRLRYRTHPDSAVRVLKDPEYRALSAR